MILYQNLEFDIQQPWEGFLQNRLLIMVLEAFVGRKLSDLSRTRCTDISSGPNLDSHQLFLRQSP